MTPLTISYENFQNLIAERSMAYLRAAVFLAKQEDFGHILTRPLLGELLSHASQMEELLDSYGARNIPLGAFSFSHGRDQTLFKRQL